jgi:hypothetical protein
MKKQLALDHALPRFEMDPVRPSDDIHSVGAAEPPKIRA